jgi:hypothetical protein
MNDKVELVERELEGLDFVDLGDAAEETKQVAPSTVYPDSTYVWGWASR